MGQTKQLSRLATAAILSLIGLATAFALGLFPRQTSVPSTATSLPWCQGAARCFEGGVTSIVDGDTLDIGGIRVRLALVNTPERGASGYRAAKDFTTRLCPPGSKALVDEDDGQRGGSFGRLIAVVYCDGRNLNASLLENGHASILRRFCNVSEFARQPWAQRYGC